MPKMKLTVDNLVKNDLPVYVTNQTSPRGQILINFVDVGGRSRNVQIPPTFIPICLNDFIAPQTIRNSHDLRQYIRQGNLKLMAPKKAEAVLDTSEARTEKKRLQQRGRKARNAVIDARRKHLDKQAVNANEGLPNEPESPVPPENQYTPDKEPGEQIQARVLSVVQRLNSGDLRVADAMGDLRGRADELTENDLSYLIAQTTGQVRAWAQKELAQKTGLEPEYIDPEEEADDGPVEEIEDDGSESSSKKKKKKGKRTRSRRR